ncbi:MAG: nucleotidyltransferase domain-containing protein [Desulforhopalus sp.]
MKYGLSQQDIEEICKAFNLFPEIDEAVLFGSRAKGNYKSGSDVDIAIKGENIQHSCVSRLSDILNEESRLPYYFDIVHFEQITEPELVLHIERVGKLLYER